MLKGDTLILTKKGWLPISSLKKGMIIASPKGYFVRIKEIHTVKNFKDRLFIIRQASITPEKPSMPVYLTGTHQYYTHRFGKPFLPKNKLTTKFIPANPITLYNIELNNKNDTLFANKMIVSSFR